MSVLFICRECNILQGLASCKKCGKPTESCGQYHFKEDRTAQIERELAELREAIKNK